LIILKEITVNFLSFSSRTWLGFLERSGEGNFIIRKFLATFCCLASLAEEIILRLLPLEKKLFQFFVSIALLEKSKATAEGRERETRVIAKAFFKYLLCREVNSIETCYCCLRHCQRGIAVIRILKWILRFVLLNN